MYQFEIVSSLRRNAPDSRETDSSDTVGPIAGISSTNAKYSNFADSVCEISACSVDVTDTVCHIFPIDGLDKIRNAVSEIFSPSKIYDTVAEIDTKAIRRLPESF